MCFSPKQLSFNVSVLRKGKINPHRISLADYRSVFLCFFQNPFMNVRNYKKFRRQTQVIKLALKMFLYS